MNELVPPHYKTPKIAFFSGVEDRESHLKAFEVRMIISRESNGIRCKMLMGTFTRTTLQWFSGIPDGHITFFLRFDRMFKEQFPSNKVNPPQLYDMFNDRHSKGESLKGYLNRFCTVSVRLRTQDEEMVVVAFVRDDNKLVQRFTN